MALGIEKCLCPPAYVGLSCQDPADGYYRVRPEIETFDEYHIEVLIGYAERCECHGHAPSCNRETGVCTNCLHNTAGKQCEVCAPGYYGDAKRGTSRDCRPCDCGSHRNATCHPSPDGFGFICDTCAPGLAGDKCDECAPGYYGNPNVIDGCIDCRCNIHGSRSIACDPITGQCPCYEGILGKTCDQCGPRFAVVDGRCESCLEGCTGLLFDEIDNIREELIRFNITTDMLLPWQYLKQVEDKIANLSKIEVVKATDFPDLQMFFYETEQLTSISNELAARAHISSSEGERVAVDGKELKKLTDGLADDLEEIRILRQAVEDIINEILNRIDRGDFNLDSALAESERILRELQAKNLTMDLIQVDRERRLSEALLEKVRMFIMDHSLDTDTYAAMVTDLTDQLNDLLRRSADTNNVTSHVLVMNKDNQAKIARLKESDRLLRESEQNILTTLDNARKLLQEAIGFNNDTIANNNFIERTDTQLNFDLSAVSAKVDRLTGDNDELTPFVEDAVDHADSLADLAQQLTAQFEGTRDLARDPVKAARAFDRMVEAVESAEEAVQQAQEAVHNATQQVLEGDDGDLRERAAAALELSNTLNSQADDVKDATSRFEPELESHQRDLDLVEDDVGRVRSDLARLNDRLDNTGIDITDQVNEVKYSAATTIAKSNEVYDRAFEIQHNAENIMTPKLHDISQVNSMDGIDEAQAAVNQVRDSIREAKNLTDALTEKADNIRHLAQGIQLDLDALRDKIEQTRAQADSIRVSLHHEDSCYRRYDLGVQEATTKNTVKLHFRLDKTLQDDMLLFLLSTPDKGDFLALEIIDGWMRFSWSAGEGSDFVDDKIQRIRYEYDEEDEKKGWYQVTARRIGKLGILSVKNMSSAGPATNIEHSAASDNITILIDNTTDVFIGGVPDYYLLPGNLQATVFDGCMGEVSFNDKPIGLYNFRELTGQGCTGCKPVPGEKETKTEATFSFDGSGYATLPQVKYNSRNFFIDMDFKTFWSDALLFFTYDPESGNFISLELVNGRVVFKFSFGGDSLVEMATRSQYNTNTWVSVEARKIERNASLTVEQETQDMAGIARSSLNLRNAVLNFAGVPLVTRQYTNKLNITGASFYGCIRNLKITSREVVDLDLGTGLFKGMLPFCPEETAHVVGFEGDGGYLEMRGSDIQKLATIIFSFRTEQEEALLILGRGEEPNAFYSVSLLGGHVELYMNGGRQLRTLTSRRRYDDGRLHTVTIVKSNRLVQLYIDDLAEGSVRLASGDARIAALRNNGGLFLGGLPYGEDALGMSATFMSLRGCISDFVIDRSLLSFDNPVRFYKADVGRCREVALFGNVSAGAGSIDEEVEPITNPVPSFTVTVRRPDPVTRPPPPTTPTYAGLVATTPLPTECAVEGPFARMSDSVAFGAVKRSHASVEVKRRSIIRDFEVTLEFRTFYPRGLVLYVANTEQNEYIAIEMVRGKVLVSYEGKNLANEMEMEGSLNDGLWHYLRVVKEERSITVQVDGEDASEEEIARRLDVNSTIHVGGLPEIVTPRDGLVSESFKGCMRDFHLNREPISLSGVQTVSGVQRCFEHIERGAYFDGYSYAVFANHYQIDRLYSIRLDFKTTQRNAVLISISSSPTSGMTLELYDGVLQLSAVNAGGRFTALSSVCAHCLCDDRWHSVQAELIRNVVTLQVDGAQPTVGPSPGYVMSLGTDSELFIGGLPVRAIPQSAASGSDFFRGCIRNLVMNNTAASWHDMESLWDVHVSACPVTLP